MDDIFYMSSKNVRIKDIDEIAKRINVKKTFMPQSTDVLEVEYCDGVMVNWFRMRLEDFQELEDTKFLSDNKIKSIFCISHHSSHFPLILPHIKILLQEYGGWIGNDAEGFHPCFNISTLDTPTGSHRVFINLDPKAGKTNKNSQFPYYRGNK